jgi:hypothetical protein
MLTYNMAQPHEHGSNHPPGDRLKLSDAQVAAAMSHMQMQGIE